MAKPRALSKRPGCHYLLALVLSAAVVLPLLVPAASAAAAVAVPVAEADGENKSARATRQWATGKGEEELVAEKEADRIDSVVEDEFAGGFGSLDSMLQWAIGTAVREIESQ